MLHLEEEDFSDPEKNSEEEDEDDDDPIKKIIQSRYYFSLHAILANPDIFTVVSCHCIHSKIVMPLNMKHIICICGPLNCPLCPGCYS